MNVEISDKTLLTVILGILSAMFGILVWVFMEIYGQVVLNQDMIGDLKDLATSAQIRDECLAKKQEMLFQLSTEEKTCETPTANR